MSVIRSHSIKQNKNKHFFFFFFFFFSINPVNTPSSFLPSFIHSLTASLQHNTHSLTHSQLLVKQREDGCALSSCGGMDPRFHHQTDMASINHPSFISEDNGAAPTQVDVHSSRSAASIHNHTLEYNRGQGQNYICTSYIHGLLVHSLISINQSPAHCMTHTHIRLQSIHPAVDKASRQAGQSHSLCIFTHLL